MVVVVVFFCISMGESYIYFYDYMCNREESLKYRYLKTTLVFFFCLFFFTGSLTGPKASSLSTSLVTEIISTYFSALYITC